jgi:hypothetical protein
MYVMNNLTNDVFNSNFVQTKTEVCGFAAINNLHKKI